MCTLDSRTWIRLSSGTNVNRPGTVLVLWTLEPGVLESRSIGQYGVLEQSGKLRSTSLRKWSQCVVKRGSLIEKERDIAYNGMEGRGQPYWGIGAKASSYGVHWLKWKRNCVQWKAEMVSRSSQVSLAETDNTRELHKWTYLYVTLNIALLNFTNCGVLEPNLSLGATALQWGVTNPKGKSVLSNQIVGQILIPAYSCDPCHGTYTLWRWSWYQKLSIYNWLKMHNYGFMASNKRPRQHHWRNIKLIQKLRCWNWSLKAVGDQFQAIFNLCLVVYIDLTVDILLRLCWRWGTWAASSRLISSELLHTRCQLLYVSYGVSEDWCSVHLHNQSWLNISVKEL